ncbi:ATP-dependent Clp protease ATP-binding subunit ClpC, partial [bacterium]
MFGRFTERAQKVLVLAQEEARRAHFDYVGTEHLLLGLIREGGGIAARVLQGMGIEMQQVRDEVEKIMGKGNFNGYGEIGFTPRSKKVLELSFDEARHLGHNYIGTEHLLLGLIREGEGVAARVLENLGANLEKVREGIIEMLSGANPPAGAPKGENQSGNTPTLNEFGRD